MQQFPDLPGKTLIFALNDAHADLVVDEVRRAFREMYGEVEDEAVKKLTGSVDRVGEAIRKYRNDALPTIAVTVDLLTTGIDVPSIVNLVFLRRVNSRILYEQMLGRATRRCDEIGKETFRIFDAVGIYEQLQALTEMKPVVVNPKISFEQLFRELGELVDEALQARVRDQLLVQLRRKAKTLHEQARAQYEAAAGGPLYVPISHHPDRVVEVRSGYGSRRRPEDFLEGFARFVRDNVNQIAALGLVVQRPRELTAISRLLFLALLAFVQQRGGDVYYAPLRVEVRPGKFREPDLLLVLDKDDPRAQGEYWRGADLVVEIGGPDNPRRDTEEKPRDYAEAGIAEYWIVNPLTGTITVLALDGASYAEHGSFRRGERAASRLLDGFSVSVDEVFAAA